MKRTCLVALACCILASAAMGAESPGMAWHHDGSVRIGTTTIKTGLQNASLAVADGDGLLIGGDGIDAEGINHPMLVFVPGDPAKLEAWPMPASVGQFFHRAGRIQVLLSDGAVLQRSADGWEATGLELGKDAVVLASGEELIACRPDALAMAGGHDGHCRSLTRGWIREAHWQSIAKPELCAGKLIVTEQRHANGVRLLQIDPVDGSVLATREMRAAPRAACRVTFPK